MDEMLKFLDGSKTYLVSMFVLILAFLKLVMGWDFPGIDMADPWMSIQIALSAMFLRRGVKTS